MGKSVTQKQMRMVRLKTGVEQSVKDCRECRYRMTTIVMGEPNGEKRNDDQPHLFTVSPSEDAIPIAAAIEKSQVSS